MLSIRNLSLVAENGEERKEILKGINLDIDDSKFVVLTGPNGGGKTTLAKVIMGLVKPTSGKIYYNDVDITDMSITERARLGISYGFQQPPRFKGLKVRDLLELASGKDKLSTTECCMYLNKVGLCAADYIDREVDTSLSGGEVKRIEIATILARNSSLMIFDEPEAGIDLWSFNNLIKVFENMHERTKGNIIIISHQERILNIADKILLLKAGEIDCYGEGKEILPKLLGVQSECCISRKEIK